MYGFIIVSYSQKTSYHRLLLRIRYVSDHHPVLNHLAEVCKAFVHKEGHLLLRSHTEPSFVLQILDQIHYEYVHSLLLSQIDLFDYVS